MTSEKPQVPERRFSTLFTGLPVTARGAGLGTVGSVGLWVVLLFVPGGAQALILGGWLLLLFSLVFGSIVGIAAGLVTYRFSASDHKPFLVALFSPPLAELVFFFLLAGPVDRAYLELSRGFISGRVVDEGGRPVQGVLVSNGGSIEVTDAEGHYRIGPLPPGDYYLVAKPESMTVVPDQLRAMGFGYALTYYPTSTNPLDARPVSVTRANRSGVDITIVQTRTPSVSGVVTRPDGEFATHGQVLLYGDRYSPLSTNIGPGGVFAFPHVPPGTWHMKTNTRYVTYEDQDCTVAVIHVSDTDIRDLALVTSPATSVSGRLLFEGVDVQKPDRPGPWIRAHIVRGVEAAAGQWSTVPKDDSTFEMKGLCGPPWWIRVDRLPPEWALEAVMLSGRDVTDVGVDFRGMQGGKELDVVLTSREVTEVRGRIVNFDGAQQYGVIVFASDPRLWGYGSRFVRRAVFDRNSGEFTIRGLPSADYLLATLDRGVELALSASGSFAANVPAEVLQRLRTSATPFHLDAGEAKTVVLRQESVGQ